MTSSIAGIGVTGSSMAYSVSKAAGNSVGYPDKLYFNICEAFN